MIEIEIALGNLKNLTFQKLLQRWLPEVAMFFVTLKECWKDLVPMKRGESLGQVKHHKETVHLIFQQIYEQLQI
jgi:hypothetical protein